MSEKSIPAELNRPARTTAGFFAFINRRWLNIWLRRSLVVIGLIGFAIAEVRTSAVQSWIFTSLNLRINFSVKDGRSADIAFPKAGPFDQQRGYVRLPQFQERLEAQGFIVTRQVRQTDTTMNIIDYGISPPYREPPETGLKILGANGATLFRYAQTDFLFDKIETVPPLLIKTLLFLENRDLDRPSSPWHNPVIEWDRTLKASLMYLAAKLQLPVPVQGGSTLAVQLEKFRHSPNGRTETPLEKLRQVIGASLKAYRDGANTRESRDQIIVDYLNTVPLAATPGYGEIHGLGEGLYAWFAMPLADVIGMLNAPTMTRAKVRAYKHVLALLVSVRAPSTYLVDERLALEEKINQFVRLMAREAVIDWEFATELQQAPLQFSSSAPLPPKPSSAKNKAGNAVRTITMDALGINNLYELNRLHLQAQSTFDVPLQQKIVNFFSRLNEPTVVRALGFDGTRMLENADPSKVVYSFLLVEPTATGNLVRVQADSLPGPVDFNRAVKLELGSTAKLRTLTHYLELVAELHASLGNLNDEELSSVAQSGRDTLSQWVAATLVQQPNIALTELLEQAMERTFSANSHEGFFTGGGIHYFDNFDPAENDRIYTVRQAFQWSNNLAFIRLMRELVAYHRAQLPYDAHDVMTNLAGNERRRMLTEIAEEESRAILRRSYQIYSKQSHAAILQRLIGGERNPARRLAILFFAWRIGAGEQALADWLRQNDIPNPDEEISTLYQAYQNPRLNLADYAYLLSVHPLELWCAGTFARRPDISWQELYDASAEARRIGSAWLLSNRNRRAQDNRLRIRIEREAFARMLPYWQRLGFPFKSLVPSYATAIGNSSDRPIALAELIGILVNNGVKVPTLSLTDLHFAEGTPYETRLARLPNRGERVLAPEVAQVVRQAMADVVEHGTARHLSGAFRLSNNEPMAVGGKTGSGDNRYETFNRQGGVIASRTTSRTATFVFYIGQRYFGVITAYVQGKEAANYKFTSALPVAIMRVLAPTLMAQIDPRVTPTPLMPPAENLQGGERLQNIAAPVSLQRRAQGEY